MRLKTREGVLLLVSVGWDENYPQEPVIWFRFDNQQLCSSYFISTFQAIPDDEGLCLDGGECLIKPGETLVYDISLKKTAIPPP